jgi:hypothetical protein
MKYVHLVPTEDKLTTKGFTRLFMQLVLANHGMTNLPLKGVVSDRDPRWRGYFWQNV